MQLSEIIALSSLIAVNAGINIGIYKYFNNKIDRIYGRFDEHKKKIDEIYVRKDMCQIMHENTASTLIGVEKRMGERFEKLDKRIDDTFAAIDCKITKLLTK